jgi:hypothetical protein
MNEAKKILETKRLSQKAFLDSLYESKQRREYHIETLEKSMRLTKQKLISAYS